MRFEDDIWKSLATSGLKWLFQIERKEFDVERLSIITTLLALNNITTLLPISTLLALKIITTLLPITMRHFYDPDHPKPVHTDKQQTNRIWTSRYRPKDKPALVFAGGQKRFRMDFFSNEIWRWCLKISSYQWIRMAFSDRKEFDVERLSIITTLLELNNITTLMPFATLLALKIITTLLPLTMRHFNATLWPGSPVAIRYNPHQTDRQDLNVRV